MRTAKVVSVSLPPDMEKQLASIAKEERRSISEIFREALRRYMLQRALEDVRHQVRIAAQGLTEDDVVRIINEDREAQSKNMSGH